jgi:hypothetical protein
MIETTILICLIALVYCVEKRKEEQNESQKLRSETQPQQVRSS